jgi:hypothetical protein
MMSLDLIVTKLHVDLDFSTSKKVFVEKDSSLDHLNRLLSTPCTVVLSLLMSLLNYDYFHLFDSSNKFYSYSSFGVKIYHRCIKKS